MKKILTTLLLISCALPFQAQFDEDQLGAWYMYFFSVKFSEEGPWGAQGDIQFRNWDLGGDLEQLLLRGGVTYTPDNAKIKFTLGYGNITTGAFGDSDATSAESRIYQEALFPTLLGRFHLTHRMRFEQRWVEDQDTRSRYRYMLFVNVPFNQKDLDEGAIYLALYNELFVNGQRNIGDGRTVELFDRNRTYTALGYSIQKNLRVQLGVMRQVTDNWSKDQLQLSLHHSF
ncbi:MAG: DUF2490 domain-containing protein [Flavobacteriales bacterium]|nr:DUF2490 domain-containing protein [Flavobacteriales bacterium]